MTHSIQTTKTPSISADAVFAGGGVRCIAHVGALSVAEQRGYTWVHIAGTSAGAIVAALVAAGYTATELYKIMSQLDYTRFADHSTYDWFHLRDIYNILRCGGLHTGEYLETFMRDKLQAKGIRTFGDLIIPEQADDPRFRYRLTVIASDITTGNMLRLPHDASLYGIDPDTLDVARAVRMSASIPFFFIPVNQARPDGRISCIVDGGLLSNFPISIFDVQNHEPLRPTLGFHFVQSRSLNAGYPYPFMRACNTLEIIPAMVSTLLSASDRLYLEDHAYVRTIAIPTSGIGITQFDLTPKDIQVLYQNGQQAAHDFFTTWDFEAYKAAYRRNNFVPTRQERLHADMKVIESISHHLNGNE